MRCLIKEAIMEVLTYRNITLFTGLTFLAIIMTFLALNQPSIIGAASGQNTTSGIANVSIQTVVQVNLVNRTVDFGFGFVNGSDVACTLESNNSNRLNSTNGTAKVACANASGGFGFFAPARDANFLIENAGNVNITLTINGSYATARQFLCDPLNINQNCSFFTPEYTWQAANAEANTCNTAGQMVQGYTKNLTSAIQTVCSNMNFSAANNQIQIALRLMIPRDSKQGLLTDNVTFTGTN